MKAVYILGILLFMLATVSSASAAAYTIDTSNTGDAVNIRVVYDGVKTITFTDLSTDANSGIVWAAYNVNSNAEKITGKTFSGGTKVIYPATDRFAWSVKNFGATGEFGSFLKCYGGAAPPPARYKTVTVTLISTGNPMLPNNPLGNSVGVHYIFSDDKSCFASENGETTPIPEFPSMVLPVAAILGLLFISQRRKEN